ATRLGELEIQPAASIGVAFYPADGTTIESLYAHADAAMYCAKQRGGSTFECFTASMSQASEDRVRFEGDLHRALKQQQLELHYQPKFKGVSRRIHSAEALVRWQHPERGLIMPDRFIPLAEETGLIVPIGEWVLQAACAQGREWRRRGFPPLVISVNLSSRQLWTGGLVRIVGDTMVASGMSEYLELELTESMVMHDVE